MSDLTDKQKRFCDQYLIDLNATQAAYRAGYSKKTSRQIGQKLLSKVDIQAYIEEKRKKIEKKTDVTIEWIINELVDTYEHCRQKIAVLDHEGNETGEYRFEASAANRSLELLGKHLGMFSDKLRVTGADDDSPIKHTVTTTIEGVMVRLSEHASKTGAAKDTSESTDGED